MIKIAIQKSGRLSDQSLELLQECGIKIYTGDRKLKTTATNFPMEILFLRDDDIPQYVEQGVAHIGILGQNEVMEKNKNVNEVAQLGFAKCNLSLAIPKDEVYTGLSWFNNKRVATSYPHILATFFKEKNIHAEIEEIGGSVEIAPGIGLADGIFDIVSTGSTLLMNGLKETDVVMQSQAVLIGNKNLNELEKQLLAKLLFRIKSVRKAASNKYILLNAPLASVDKIAAILPGMRSPTVLPLNEPGWCSIHSVVAEDVFWDVIEELTNLGAQGILVVPIEKMVL